MWLNNYVQVSYNSGSISGDENIGGIVGDMSGSDAYTSEILNCYNTGKIASNRIVGGIVGNLNGENNKIRYCYNIGEIEGKGSNHFKGSIVGNKWSGIIQDCYYSNETGIKAVENQDDEINNVYGLTDEYMISSEFVNLLNAEQTELFWKKGNSSYEYAMLDWQEYQKEITITSEKYEISGKRITKISDQTTLESFKESISTISTAEISVLDKNNNPITEKEKVGTGMTLEIKTEEGTRTLKLVIAGDSTGDGSVDFKDIVALNMHKLNKNILKDEYLIAGEVTGDGTVDFKDIVKVNKFRLKKITQLF